MQKLFSIESIKTFNSNTFRTVIALHLLFFVLVVLGISRVNFSTGSFSIGQLYEFPNVWGFFSWIASWFNILLSVLIIVIVSNEFRYKTFRQHFINGLTIGELLTGKIITLFYIAFYALLLVIVSSLVSGFISTPEPSLKDILASSGIVFVYFIQAVSYMSFGLLIAVIFRSNALSIIVFFLYLFPGEVILRKWLFPSLENFFPVKIISNLTPLPDLIGDRVHQAQNMTQGLQGTQIADDSISQPMIMLIAVGYFILFSGISYLVLKSRSI
ncbi:MAG: hypothetical protein R6U04_09975 [Bacteroidales bacterium]